MRSQQQGDVLPVLIPLHSALMHMGFAFAVFHDTPFSDALSEGSGILLTSRFICLTRPMFDTALDLCHSGQLNDKFFALVWVLIIWKGLADTLARGRFTQQLTTVRIIYAEKVPGTDLTINE